jgi:hypothetical protein
MIKKWWQEAIIYQCYIRSFYDSNNDGIGDIRGIIEKLDYFEELGINTLWISPHYKSPMDDNGYDISDFYEVSDDYGNIEDIRKLISELHDRDMKIVFDLVLKLDGTLSGEHGVGIEKRDFVDREIEPVTLALMKRIKKEFDPNLILNPGKMFPSD